MVKSDGSNVRVGACLLLVRCGEDGEVTPEMMLDANRVRLISVDSKTLSIAEQKWLRFEVEAYGMYRTLRKWAGLLTKIEQLGPGTWPPLLWMDSTTAMSKWIGATGHRLRKREGEEVSVVGREDILCDTHEDGDAMDCKASE